MDRTEGTKMRLELLVTAFVLALLVLGMASAAHAASPGTLEPDFEIQPIEGKIIKLTRPIRCPDRMCPDDGRGCSCKRPTEVRPPIRLPIELTSPSAATPEALTSGVQPVAGLVSVVPSIIRCPDRMCPDGGRSCGCGGPTEDRPPARLPIGQPGLPTLTE